MPSTRNPPTARTVADNIVADYGREAFRQLIQMFRDRKSGAYIGHVFGVSRQRVSQWRRALGNEQTTYTPHPSIVDLVERPPRTGRRTAV